LQQHQLIRPDLGNLALRRLPAAMIRIETNRSLRP
jgi:hypothetical protein